jgi:Na+-translocating ferredoxin:NAD+ oxidoreductase RnfE subunit
MAGNWHAQHAKCGGVGEKRDPRSQKAASLNQGIAIDHGGGLCRGFRLLGAVGDVLGTGSWFQGAGAMSGEAELDPGRTSLELV